MYKLIYEVRARDWRALLLNILELEGSVDRLIKRLSNFHILVGKESPAKVHGLMLPLTWKGDSFICLLPGINGRIPYPVILVLAAKQTFIKQGSSFVPTVLAVLKDPTLNNIRYTLSQYKKESKLPLFRILSFSLKQNSQLRYCFTNLS